MVGFMMPAVHVWLAVLALQNLTACFLLHSKDFLSREVDDLDLNMEVIVVFANDTV
jgi:hypothetical protein